MREHRAGRGLEVDLEPREGCGRAEMGMGDVSTQSKAHRKRAPKRRTQSIWRRSPRSRRVTGGSRLLCSPRPHQLEAFGAISFLKKSKPRVTALSDRLVLAEQAGVVVVLQGGPYRSRRHVCDGRALVAKPALPSLSRRGHLFPPTPAKTCTSGLTQPLHRLLQYGLYRTCILTLIESSVAPGSRWLRAGYFLGLVCWRLSEFMQPPPSRGASTPFPCESMFAELWGRKYPHSPLTGNASSQSHC